MNEQLFEDYCDKEKESALSVLSEEEELGPQGLRKVVDNFVYTQKAPLRDEVLEIRKARPRLAERRTIAERIIERIREFVDVFIDGVD